MKMGLSATCLIALVGLAACAATPGDGSRAKAATSEGGAADAGSQNAFTPIAEPSLPLGKCGLILWTLEAEQPSAVFRMVAGENAEIAIDGVPFSLALSDSDGRSQFGVSESQTFSSPEGEAQLKFTFGLGFDGGVYVERGLLSFNRPDGWRLLAPVAGIAGCRTR